MRIVEDLGRTRDGGSCALCSRDYQGAPFAGGRGRRVLAESEPGVVEPFNLCAGCFEAETEPGDVPQGPHDPPAR